MSIVAYYARMDQADVSTLAADPEKYWQLSEMPWDLTKAVDERASERLSIDKDWKVLSWLCSPRGRAEERRLLALGQIRELPNAKEEIREALVRACEAMGFDFVDPNELPLDPVLIAIQGRRDGDRSLIPDLGLAVTAFAPGEVQVLAAALNKVEESYLRERFDIREMEVLGLPADCEETELDEFFLPQIARLAAIYNRAAQVGQHVVVVMT